MLLKANSIQMNCELSGERDKPVVMLSHSLASSMVMWTPQLDVLHSKFRVLRYDVRGHGLTDVTKPPYKLEQLANDAIGLLDVLGIDKVHFVGLSMGGMIGQYVTLSRPDRIMSLVLCDTSAVMPEESKPIILERIATARNSGMRALVEPTLERWFTPAFIRKGSDMVEVIRKQILETPVDGYVGCSEAILQLNLLDRLGEIKVPTLIVVGEEDQGTPVSAARAMQERIRGSKLVVIPGARHLSNVEQAEAFNEALIEFLVNLPS